MMPDDIFDVQEPQDIQHYLEVQQVQAAREFE